MVLFFYNLALLVVLALGAPWWLWKIATTRKYRGGLAERMGRVPHRLRSTADPRPVIWLHAVSVGEVLAVSRLVAELDRAFPDFRLLVSTTTRTGQALARERLGVGRVFYCPLDLPWAVAAYLRALRPRLLILAETEFWPNLLTAFFHKQIPVAVVNARISDRSWPRYRRLRRQWRPLLKRLARVLAQSEIDAERLRLLGCADVRISGNLKFDVRAVEESEATRLLRASGNGLRFVVAGSTLAGEETALLDAWPRIVQADANLVLVLAPRHPERFPAVAALLEKAGISWMRRSEWTGPRQLHPGQIVLLDTIGELASVYSLAAAAFVGGSLVAAGGHNPLEPAQFAVPIVMGSHYANFRAIAETLLAHQALEVTSKKDLADTLIRLLHDRAAAQAMGGRAKQVFDQQAGATARCVDAIAELLAIQPAMEHVE